MSQVSFPVEVASHEVIREKTLGGAIALCVRAGGHEPKELQVDLKWDKGQWSRWESGDEGIKWTKLVQVMDYCGNDAPLLWMLHARGYELSSVKKRETEMERENRLLREQLAQERQEREVERRLFRELRTVEVAA
jgi:hypothetical protein